MNISASAVSIKCLKLKIHKINIIDSYGYTDSKCQLLTRPNVLEYIDLFQSKRQHETIIWEGLPCCLLFYIAVFYFKHGYCS